MINRLSSDNLSVTINSHGAEVISVRNKNDLEFIWQADKNIWPRHAPVLFPIVGKLKNNQFTFNNQSHELNQHGFARDMIFELIHKDDTSCTYQLVSGEETKKHFPFDFIFNIEYILQESTLITNYKVKNPSSSNLYFSVGAHPGYNCPLFPHEKQEDYYLEFESKSYSQSLLEGGLISDKTTPLFLHNKQLPISPSLFDKDALVFENNQINRISLCSSKSEHKITLICEDWPYFGIWSKKDNGQFVCLEPWMGIADSVSSNNELLSKKGIISLEPNKEFNCSFSVTFH